VSLPLSSSWSDVRSPVRGKSGSKFQTTSQARFGLIGNVSLRDEGNTDSLRSISALDGTPFLPHVMTLQRASTPWQYNTPTRTLEEAVHFEGAAEDANSPPHSRLKGPPQPLPENYVRRIRKRAQQAQQEGTVYKQQLTDLKLLGESASRSGNLYQAMQAHHRMGVVCDNQGMHSEAIQRYKQFLALCIATKNSQGEALAYNCLGINTFKVGQYDESIQYHNKHLELADNTGRLMAHTNLGIVFQAMGLVEHAAIHHQHAVELANRTGAKDAQCFTVGNLGIASAAQGDLQTSRLCLQYHLSAARRHAGDSKFVQETLKTVSKSAHQKLGQVNAVEGRLDEASSHFAEAMRVAQSKKDQASEETSSVLLGVARGMMNFEECRDARLGHRAS